MKVEWRYSRETEIDALLFTAHCIALGIYQKLGALLLETPQKTIIPSVIFPKNELPQEIWERIKKDENINADGSCSDEEIKKELHKYYKNISLLPNSEIEKIKEEFNLHKDKFFNEINNVFDRFRFDHIIIKIRQFGIGASYYPDRENRILTITVRNDMTANCIYEMIVKAQVHSDMMHKRQKEPNSMKHGIWYTKEEISNYIIKNLSFAKSFKEYHTFTDLLNSPEEKPDLKRISRENYKKLGFPTEKCISYKNNTFYFEDKVIDELPPHKKEILKFLLEKNGQIVSFEEIAKILWKDDYCEKFSLNAISKVIFKLRRILKNAGLQKEVIFTKRGEGYYLVQ